MSSIPIDARVEIRPDYLPFGRPDFSSAEIEAVTRVLQSGWVGMGGEVQRFEEELARFVAAPCVVTVSSCTAALQLSLAAIGVGPGTEVICPSLTWCATANAALYLGAEIRFADIDRRTCCVTPESMRRELTSRTKAVVPVHFGGRAIDVKELRDALPDDVAIVEDAAHALGASYPDGTPVGSSGNPTCFSFYANKNLSTAEGGAIAVHDEDLADVLRSLRQHGYAADAWKRFSDPRKLLLNPLERLGFKANYTDLQACIGRVQLRRFAELQARRREIADVYLQRLAQAQPSLEFQAGVERGDHALHLFCVLLPIERLSTDRDGVLLELRRRNIGATVHYAALHGMPFYRARLGEISLPATEQVCRRIITLPISSGMTPADAHYVCDHLLEVLRHFRTE